MAENVVSTWADLLALDDTDYVEVPVGNKVVRLGSLSIAEMRVWSGDNDDAEKSKINGLVLVAKCMVDAIGTRIGNLDEVIKLRDKQPKTVKKLVDAAVLLNSLTLKAEEKNDSSAVLPFAALTH